MNPLLQENPITTRMVQNNPALKQAIDYVNQNGGNPKEAFYKLAKERGVDPQTILNQVNNFAKL
jgi:hypothetical protein